MKWAKQIFINSHHSSCIIKFSAIIRSRKNCYKLSIWEEFISFFYYLNYSIALCTWWARQIKSKSSFFKKFSTIELEKVTETPLSLGPQLLTSLSGSDHSKSHNKPIIFKPLLFYPVLEYLLAELFSLVDQAS